MELDIIFETLHGSHLYGTSIPTSDIDYRGVALQPFKSILGMSPFEQYEQKDPDRTIFGVSKFLTLAADCNPNIVEILFAPTVGETCIKVTDTWAKILQHRYLIISRKARHTFTGYAFAQMKRMKMHHEYMTGKVPPDAQPQDFGAYRNEEGNWSWPSGIEQNAYSNAHNKWTNYNEWKKNRNPARHELEAKYGYDCYSEDTEFLTSTGWKLYDDVQNGDFLGTINPNGNFVEFQQFTERVKKPYSGLMYHLESLHTDCFVTSNHRMYVAGCHRQASNNYSTECDSVWGFNPLYTLIDGTKSNFHVLALPTNNNVDEGVTDEFLKLLGAYISEGTINFHKGNLKCARITQTPNGKQGFFDMMDSLPKEMYSGRYEYFRKNRGYDETIWCINKTLSLALYNMCGHLSRNKHLPDFYIHLTKRQAWVLLYSLLLGDGTFKERGNYVYYTNSFVLAKQVQFLSILAGHNSTVNPGFGMYQVYITGTKDTKQTNYVILNNKIEKVDYTGNIVCFTVPNESLITRHNNKVSFQGNTKHGMHLVRLITEGEELLLTGNITLPRPDAKFLLEVRNGLFTYDQIVQYAADGEQRILKAEQESKLPFGANRVAIENLLIDINFETVLKGEK
jgi:hypothetical protein